MKPRDVCSCGAFRSDDDPALIHKSVYGFASVPASTVDPAKYGHGLRACRVCAVVYFTGPVVL